MSFDNITPDTVAGIVAIFSTGLFTLLGIIAKGVFNTRSASRESRDKAEEATSEAKKARQSATKAEENTHNVGNGFASEVLARLTKIDERTHRSEQILTEHLNWHLHNGNGKTNDYLQAHRQPIHPKD